MRRVPAPTPLSLPSLGVTLETLVKGRVEINKNFSYANFQDLAEVEGHEDYH